MLRAVAEGPLAGRRVVVTRATAQASALSKRLRALGAEPLEVPTIVTVDPADGGVALQRAAAALSDGDYAWVALTSVNAVGRLLDRVSGAVQARVAAVGTGTAAALAARGVEVDLVPTEAVAEGLLAAWPALPPGGGRVLLPRAAAARHVLPDGLRAAGWEVDVVDAYRTVPAPVGPDVLAAAAAADAICFTSASTVRNWLAAAGDVLPPVVVAIGPVTAAAAASAGIEVAAEADPHTLEGVVAAVVAALAP